MTLKEPLPLYHSWPLCDLPQRFDLGLLHDDAASVPVRGSADCGTWSCELADSRLDWSPTVHRLFGFDAQDGTPDRIETVRLYAERSRAAMERLRAHAIRHCRGFTLDVEIFPIRARPRWLRLVAAPVRVDGRVVRLHGLKADVSHLYRRGA